MGRVPSELLEDAHDRHNGAGDRERVMSTERWRHEARAEIAREEAEQNMSLPPQGDHSLTALLAVERPPRAYRVARMQRTGHNAALIAQYKTGKSTLIANLIRSLESGQPFLGEFEAKRLDGSFGSWNAEMEEEDWLEYVTAAGIEATERVQLWNLRGYRLPLLSDTGAEAAIDWLRAREVEYWAIDPWARLCAWSGVNENVTAEVLPLLQRVDEVRTAAGVREVLVAHHCGHAGLHGRGASVFMDWGDALWLYSRDEVIDERGPSRWLQVEGRGVEVPNGSVTLEGGRLSYREESAKQARTREIADKLAWAVADRSLTATDAQNELGVRREDYVAGRRLAEQKGTVVETKDPDDGRVKLLMAGAENPYVKRP
jgi:hypothetical protein